jgi:hypothetical protein
MNPDTRIVLIALIAISLTLVVALGFQDALK